MGITVDGERRVVLFSNGKEERYESESELQRICHQCVEIERIIRGARAPIGVRAVPAGAIGRQGGIEKKKVLISIDKDVEIIKGLA